MTWQGKRRKQLPGNWGTIRKAVLERDGYRCTVITEERWPEQRHSMRGHPYEVWSPRCVNPGSEVHHINGPTDHRLESLRSLCESHREKPHGSS